MTSCALDRLTWPEVGRILARDPRMLLAAGALQQHGPHLPLATNALVAERVVESVSQRLGVLRAPAFLYGVPVRTGPFAGASGLRRKTFHRAVNELLACWEDHGVTEFIIVTAHRFDPHVEALLMALTASSTTTVVDLSRIELNDVLEEDPLLAHGGELETSLLMHLAPDRIRREEIGDFVPDARALRRYTRGRVPTPPPRSRGVVGRPSLATAKKGALVFRRYVDTLEAILRPRSPGPERDGEV